jgi:GT2 family glycosyltransferase
MLSEVAVNRVSGVVVTYRSRPLLTQIIKNLQHFSSFVVVDNSADSNQSVVAELSKIFPQGVYPESLKNRGYGGGNNLALSYVATEFALVINPDVDLNIASINSMIATADLYPNAIIIGAKIFDSRQKSQDISYGWRYPDNPKNPYIEPDGDLSSMFLAGCCLLIRVKPFKEIGGFDENFFMYYEELDICQRVIASGGDCVLSANSYVNHFSQSSSAPSWRVNYIKTLHYSRSKQIFLSKYGYEKKSKLGLLIRGLGHGLSSLIHFCLLNSTRGIKSFAKAHAHLCLII